MRKSKWLAWKLKLGGILMNIKIIAGAVIAALFAGAGITIAVRYSKKQNSLPYQNK